MGLVDRFSLEGNVAIVTGGGRGIGQAIALDFAKAGADVVICDLMAKDRLKTIVDEIQRLGRRSLAIKADISRKTDVNDLVQRVIDEFGSIDILVNNAGVIVVGPILDTSEDDWDKIINVDLKGYYLCSQAIGKRMVEQKKGNIISIASHAAFKALKDMGAYSIAKSGVVMLTRVLAQELGGKNIRANAIAPGMVKTELSRDNWSDTEFMRQREALLPLHRIGQTSDIVGAALFLASDASSYITGHTIIVDGGGLA